MEKDRPLTSLAARIQRHLADLTGVPDHGLRIDYHGPVEGWTASVPIRPRLDHSRWVQARGATLDEALTALAVELGVPVNRDQDSRRVTRERRAALDPV